MDKLDMAIIRELTGSILPPRRGFAPSYRQISKKLGTSPGTLRNRINIMYKSEILLGSTVFPNPNLIGLKVAAYTVEIPNSKVKADLFQKLKLVEGVYAAHDFVGSRSWVVFFYKNEAELERTHFLLNEISGTAGFLTNLFFPPCPVSFTKSEAELILHLSKNALVSYAKLGKNLGIPVRTLKREMSRLVRENMILSLPTVDYTAIEGCVPADLLVFFEDNKARAEAVSKVLEIVMDHLILASMYDVVGMCSLVLPRVASTGELAARVKRISGVKDAWVEIVSEHFMEGKQFVKYIERQISDESNQLVTIIESKNSANPAHIPRRVRNDV